MKAAFLSELAIVRTFVLSFIGILAFVFVFICWAMESAAGAAAVVCAMTPMLIMFSLMGYDDQSGLAALPCRTPLCAPRHHHEPLCRPSWHALPPSSLALRYSASCSTGRFPVFSKASRQPGRFEIISSSVAATMAVLIIAAIVEPFLVKFGNTKGIRYLMCAFILAGCIDVVILTNFLRPTDVMQSILAWIEHVQLASVHRPHHRRPRHLRRKLFYQHPNLPGERPLGNRGVAPCALHRRLPHAPLIACPRLRYNLPRHKQARGEEPMNITVYLGANEGNDPSIAESARELGRMDRGKRQQPCLRRIEGRAHGDSRRGRA